jgi:hypothetical protein
MLDLPWNKEEQRTALKIAKNIGCHKFRIVEKLA